MLRRQLSYRQHRARWTAQKAQWSGRLRKKHRVLGRCKGGHQAYSGRRLIQKRLSVVRSMVHCRKEECRRIHLARGCEGVSYDIGLRCSNQSRHVSVGIGEVSRDRYDELRLDTMSKLPVPMETYILAGQFP